ncbi:response regulator [Balneolaceae bacterium YR4-1]|uniref:Response regulator n=1 Tax=Halalkalibaculum roseum TaxID=2709311 RepID=A0A6M1SJY3_9BACT|nr:response regulator [Halalkalibaculum roseum]NGP75601.1 response regulator [Halalkalibaculum roseum]
MKGNGKKVLIVEDDLLISMLEQRMLTNLGFKISETVTSGEEAVDVFGNQHIDLIIMDIALEGKLDGVEASQQVRKSEPSVPIIFISGNIKQYEDEISKLSSPIIKISKPFTSQDLSEAVDQIFS